MPGGALIMGSAKEAMKIKGVYDLNTIV